MVGVGGLQADAVGFLVKLLQGHVVPADQGNDHFAVVRRLAVLNHHPVAVANLFIDHRLAAHAEHVGVALAGDQRIRDANGLGPGNRLDGLPGCDVTQHR